ncbi:hypothetical protein PGB90_010375 [Kerria lacca]
MLNIVNGAIKNNSKDTTQEDTYKHIYRKKTKWELWRLSLTMMGIEIVYSVMAAFIAPLLYMYGMPRDKANFVWAVGPLLGLIFTPLLGSLSDRCKFSLGRRRPFILFLTALDVIGLLLLANSNVIGTIFGDKKIDIFSFNDTRPFTELVNNKMMKTKNIDTYYWTVVSIIISTILVDFATDSLISPSQAYVLDVCVVEDHDKVLCMNTVLSGFGGVIGHIIGWINWRETIIYNVVENYVQVLFYTAAGLLITSVLATITTFKEIPLKKINSTDFQNQQDFNLNTEKEKKQFVDYLKTIVSVPYSLKILWITNLLFWMSHENYNLYFTHFVGSVVFGGDPSAPQHSEKFQYYENGIRFGCIALSANGISGILYSFVVPKIINMFGIKQVYTATILLNAISLMVMAVVKSQIFVIFLSAMSGIIYYTSFAIPYMLVAHYHSENEQDAKNTSNKQIRGLGTDLSIISTGICIAQFINSLVIGKIMSIMGVTFAVIGLSSILSFMAAVTASQIVYKNS